MNHGFRKFVTDFTHNGNKYQTNLLLFDRFNYIGELLKLLPALKNQACEALWFNFRKEGELGGLFIGQKSPCQKPRAFWKSPNKNWSFQESP